MTPRLNLRVEDTESTEDTENTRATVMVTATATVTATAEVPMMRTTMRRRVSTVPPQKRKNERQPMTDELH